MTGLWLKFSQGEIASGIELAVRALGLWSGEPFGQMEESIGHAQVACPPGDLRAVLVGLLLEILQ